MRLRVLLVEPDPGDAELVQIWLRRAQENRYEIWHVESLGDAEGCLAKHTFDLALVDLSLPDAPGPWAFHALHERCPDLPIIVFSSFAEAEAAGRLLSEGAHDHLVKGQMSGETLIRSMRHGIEHGSMSRALREAREQAEDAARARAELVAELAQEFRTPLHTVLGMADLLLETELTREQEGYVRSFLRASESLLGRLDGLLGGSAGGARGRRREADQAHDACLGARIGPGASLRALVVDDSEPTRKRTLELMRAGGHAADPAPGGRVALEMFREGDYDVVLLDMQMPDLSGFETARELRTLEDVLGRQPVPILAVTGLASEEDVRACLEAGCDDHLQKPLSREALLEALARHAPKHHQRLLRIEGATAEEMDRYLHERHNDLAAVRFALESDDLEAVRAVGNELESSAERQGFHELAEIGRGLRTAADTNDRSTVEQVAGQLVEFLREVKFVVGGPPG
jgi:CheY-like chemotaxis protein